MFKFNVGDKEYKIKFGYIATLKERVLSKVVNLQSQSDKGFEEIEDFLLYIPEILLVGLQTYHKKEFGYNYDTKEGKEKALAKVFDIVEEYTADGENDIIELFNKVFEELQNDSFLKKMMERLKDSPEDETTPEDTAENLKIVENKEN